MTSCLIIWDTRYRIELCDSIPKSHSFPKPADQDDVFGRGAAGEEGWLAVAGEVEPRDLIGREIGHRFGAPLAMGILQMFETPAPICERIS